MKALLPTGPGAHRFALGASMNSIGIGVFYSFALLYYRTISGLDLATIGTVLTVATLAVLPLMPLVGRLADRFGPKHLLVAAALVRAVAFAGYETTRGLVAFTVLTMVTAIGTRSEQLAAPMLCASVAGGESATWIALYRTAFNAGLGSGALLASVLVASTGYYTLGIATGFCFLAAAIAYVTLPPTPPAPAPEWTRPLPAWRDPVFLRIALVNGVFWLAALVLEYGLPVYLVQSLELPTWTVGGFFAVNTAVVTVLQLPVGRRLQQLDQARAAVIGGLLYVVASLVLALAGPLDSGMRLGGVLIVALVWTAGELIIGQCVTVLLTRLAPPDRRGGYLAFNQVFVGIATAFAPLLVAITLVASAPLLWWVLAAVVVCAVLLIPLRRARLPVSQPNP